MARESIQKKLERVRLPRVQITYEVGSATAVKVRELPFVIGILGDFSGSRQDRLRWRERSFLTIDFENFNNVLASLQPRACFKIQLAGAEMDVDLTFNSMEDFDPERVVQRIEPLRALHESASSGRKGELSRYLDRVLHAPEFQRIESAWRSLWYLVSRVETSAQLKIKLIDVTKQELLRDIQTAPHPDQSFLFKRVYEEPWGWSDDEPFGMFIGDFTFSRHPEDIELLSGVAHIAAVCLSPFIAAADAEMFNLDTFLRLSAVRDVARVFDSTAYAPWMQFRASEDSRYVGLTVPRILMRSPYGVRPGIIGDFQYEEDTGGDQHLLWGNAAYAVGVCIANAFSRYGWCGAIRGVEGGGLVEGLPSFVRDIDDDGKIRSGLEAVITDRHENEIASLGFIPLVQCKGADYAAFFSMQSCCKPKMYLDPGANVHGRLSCQLPYILTASRFMHYLKAIVRDRIGSYETRAMCERVLNDWISQYCTMDDQASPAVKARYPLRDAKVEVMEIPEKPGCYRAVAFLRPHFQLDELSVSLRFVTDLPAVR